MQSFFHFVNSSFECDPHSVGFFSELRFSRRNLGNFSGDDRLQFFFCSSTDLLRLRICKGREMRKYLMCWCEGGWGKEGRQGR